MHVVHCLIDVSIGAAYVYCSGRSALKNESSVGCDELNNYAGFFLNTTLDHMDPINYGYITSTEPQIGYTVRSSAGNPAEHLLHGLSKGIT